jgi:hypothetical protein
MKNKDVVGIDVSKLTIDAYIQLSQVHAVFKRRVLNNWLDGLRKTSIVRWRNS